MADEDAVANRMHVEAAENAAATVQDMVDELADERAGDPPAAIADELEDKWSEHYGDTAAPIADETANTIAEQVSRGEDVTVVPPERPGAD